MSVGEREVAGDLSVESGEELERQQRLTEHTDFDPYRWRVSPEKAAEMEFFLKGDLLEVNPLLEAPEYDTVEIVGVRNPDASADARRQYVESALLEFNDKESFDQVVAALQGEENEFTEQQPDSTIPMGRDFDWRGTEINIALSPGVPGESYSLDSYFARARRPDFGNQVSLVQARDNLGSERRTALHSVVNELKQIGATVYLTGSSVEKDSDPDDIDLAVEGLTENTDTPHYRAHCYPLPGGKDIRRFQRITPVFPAG